MLTHTTPDQLRKVGRDSDEPVSASRPWRFALMALIAAPATGLVIAAETVEGAADPSIAWSAITAGGLLAWLILATWFALRYNSRSAGRPVFVSRWVACCGYWLIAIAVMTTIAFVLGDPFGHVIRNFRFGASDIVDMGLLAAIILSLVAGGATLFDASDHRRAERAWRDHM